ncbi:Asparagine synthetase [glutamine-hydrolyzing] 1 [subsurface metagenome]
MSGIAGIINFDKDKIDTGLLKRMMDVMRHRGPDGEGFYTNSRGNVGFSYRKLSVTGSKTSCQPVSNEDETIWIICDGTIYNSSDLRKELESKGHRFKTNNNAEVIIHCYEEYDEERCLEQLQGPFAFAIWNERKQKLFLARDRVGQKPLSYFYDGKRFICVSEIKAILEDRTISRELNYQALDEYFSYGYIGAPRSIFKEIHKLKPAHYMVVDERGVTERPYWEILFTGEFEGRPDNELIQGFLERFEEAVKIRMIDEVPTGALLSGGFDSSSIVAMMARNSSELIKTFTIGFKEEAFNEAPYAQIVAEHFGTEHHTLTVTPDLVGILEKLVWQYDEPFGDSSAVPTYYVTKLASEHVPVVLSGDGGDELLGGYNKYLRALGELKYDQGFYWNMKPLAKMLTRYYPRYAPGGNLLRDLSLDKYERFIRLQTIRQDIKELLYSNDFKQKLRGFDLFHIKLHLISKDMDFLSNLQYNDFKYYLPNDGIVKVERMAALNGLDVRAPFMDRKLIEFVAKIPSQKKVQTGITKFLFKRAMQDILPWDIIQRSKAGFATPIKNWLTGELWSFVQEMLGDKFKNRGYFSKKGVSWLLRIHKSGLKNLDSKLWFLLCFEMWCQRYLD